MTRFEAIGMNIQRKAYRQDWAKKKMAESCYICVTKNCPVRCDRCMINEMHQRVMEEMNERDKVALEKLWNLRKIGSA